MKSIELTSENFESTIAESSLPVLVDFHAQWCGPCKMLAPVLEELAAEKEEEAVIAKVDIDEARDIAQQFNIRSVPTLLLFQNGQPIAETRGVQSKASLAAMIEKASAPTA